MMSSQNVNPSSNDEYSPSSSAREENDNLVTNSPRSEEHSNHTDLNDISRSNDSESREHDDSAVEGNSEDDNTLTPGSSDTTSDQPHNTSQRRVTIPMRRDQLKQSKPSLKQFSLSFVFPKKIPQPISSVPNKLKKVLMGAIDIQLSLWKYDPELELLDLTIPEDYAEAVEGNNNMLRELVAAVRKNLCDVTKVDCVFLPCCDKPLIFLNSIRKFLPKVSLIKMSINSCDTDYLETVLTCLKKCKVDFESQFEVKFVPKQATMSNIPELQVETIQCKLGKLQLTKLVRVVFGKQVIHGEGNPLTISQPSNPTTQHPSEEALLYSDHKMLYDSSNGNPDDQCPAPVPESTLSLWNLEEIHKNYQGEGTVIAIIDTGFNAVHPAFLDSKLRKSSRILAVKSFVDDTLESTQIDDGHGTLCAGIACGESFPAYSKECELYDVHVPSGVAPKAYLVVCIIQNTHHIVEALDWILSEFTEKEEHNVDVISISVGSPVFLLVEAEVVSELVVKGVIIVGAASNPGAKDESAVSFPAALGNVLCIGSHNASGDVSKFSARGKHVHFLAPGEKMIGPGSSSLHSSVKISKGTSMAAPAMAGLICLVIEAIKKSFKPKNQTRVQKATHNFWAMRQILCEILSRTKASNVLHPASRFFSDKQTCQSVVMKVLRNISPSTYEEVQDSSARKDK